MRSIREFKNRLMDYTQNKSYGKRLWHSNFSTVGRTNYWDTLFNHCSNGMHGVLKI